MSEKKVITYCQPGGFQFTMVFDIKHLSHKQLADYLFQLWAGLTTIGVETRAGKQWILDDLPEIKWLHHCITSDLSENQLLDEVDFYRKGVFEFRVKSDDLIPIIVSSCDMITKDDGTTHYQFYDLDKLVTKEWFEGQLHWVLDRIDFKLIRVTNNSYFESVDKVVELIKDREGRLE